jgi:hypothetical protein
VCLGPRCYWRAASVATTTAQSGRTRAMVATILILCGVVVLGLDAIGGDDFSDRSGITENLSGAELRWEKSAGNLTHWGQYRHEVSGDYRRAPSSQRRMGFMVVPCRKPWRLYRDVGDRTDRSFLGIWLNEVLFLRQRHTPRSSNVGSTGWDQFLMIFIIRLKSAPYAAAAGPHQMVNASLSPC